MAELPSGTVTFLFTDIEGSTRRWEEHPDDMRKALARHDEILDQTIEAHGGVVFARLGDGIAAAFASVWEAMKATVEAQQRLAREPWIDLIGPIRVRMALHTGEGTVVDGQYMNQPLNRCARLMASGHGGQILVSGTTEPLVRDALPEGVSLHDLGEHALRDLSQPLRVFQVLIDGLPNEYPPLHTLERLPGNLRPQATTFIGRKRELTELESALAAHRLVTLTGVGGVGKTRLALQAAAQAAPGFPDGVWVIELASIGDPIAVPDVVAGVLGITEQAGMSLAESIAASLVDRERLLILDNCEHLLDATASLIEVILSRAQSVRILATSREGLRLVDEQLWPVPPLGVGEGADSESRVLFEERARAVVPEFSAAGLESTDAVVEICRQLDGIPLAIELAASRMVSMTPAEVRDRLDDRFRLLRGAGRGLDRHQTLRHAIQWSFDLLSEDEQVLLRRCSVFSDGFDVTAAVGGTRTNFDELFVLDLIDALVRKSLLSAARSVTRTRYSMLETIRQFAEEQLVAAGEGEAIRDAHAQHYAAQAVDLLQHWDGPRQREAYAWLQAEFANLRGAFRWSVTRDDLDCAATIAVVASIVAYWMGRYEPVGWAEELLASAEAQEHRLLPALYEMASLCGHSPGRSGQSILYAEAVRELCDDPRYGPNAEYLGRVTLGHGYIFATDSTDALEDPSATAYPAAEPLIALCERALRQLPDDHWVFIRSSLVSALVLGGRAAEAAALASTIIGPAEASGNPASLGMALFVKGMAFFDLDLARGEEAVRRAWAITQDSGTRMLETHTSSYLARIEYDHGDPLAALDRFTRSLLASHERGATLITAPTLTFLTVLLDRLGCYEAAATIAGSVIGTFTVHIIGDFSKSIAHLRERLGDERFQNLARQGRAMDPTAMERYALEQIDQARKLV
jgi:predicted ATPase/class 3 adenylate cyclase